MKISDDEILDVFKSEGVNCKDWLFQGTVSNCQAIRIARELIAKATTPEPKEKPTCCVCGTTENLHKDGWYGHRCNSSDCVCF